MSVTDKANYAVKQLESLDSVRSTCGFKRSLFDGNDSDAISLSVLDGDADAFGALVRTYQNVAYATALTYIRAADEANDIVQD